MVHFPRSYNRPIVPVRASTWGWQLVAGVALLHVALALPIAFRQGINWDEHIDMEIAASYLEGPRALLVGSGADSITTRLPMFTVAVLDLVGVDLSLRSARLVSIAMAVAALVGTFCLGSLLFDRRKAAVAVLLLAVSPYFVSSAPMALSEGDITAAAAVTWSTFAAVKVQQGPMWGRCALLGILLGLGISAKFSTVVLLPAMVLATLLPAAVRLGRPTAGWGRSTWPWLAASLAMAGWLTVHAIATGATLQRFAAWLPGPLYHGGVRFALVGAAWIIVVAWCWRRRRQAASAPGLIALPLLLAAITFFTIPPPHTMNPWLFYGIWRTSFASAGRLDPWFVAESAVFHFMIVLLKAGILFGVVLWGGILRAVAQLHVRADVRLPLAIMAFYGAFLLLLPLAQVRYVIPIFPLIVLFGADLLVDVARTRRRTGAALIVLMSTLLVWDYRLCYPDLSLNGYQWLGTRYFAGRSTLGYRGIAQWGEDGLEQAVRWCQSSVSPGATVVSYASARPIVTSLLENSPFRLVDGLEHRDAINDADYVLTSLNGDILDGDGPENPEGSPFKFPSYDRAVLERDFVRVFSVHRAFGLEVATVWQRRSEVR
jgi:hypothetical protein